MSQVVQCPGCRHPFETELAGGLVACPRCELSFVPSGPARSQPATSNESETAAAPIAVGLDALTELDDDEELLLQPADEPGPTTDVVRQAMRASASKKLRESQAERLAHPRGDESAPIGGKDVIGGLMFLVLSFFVGLFEAIIVNTIAVGENVPLGALQCLGAVCVVLGPPAMVVTPGERVKLFVGVALSLAAVIGALCILALSGIAAAMEAERPGSGMEVAVVPVLFFLFVQLAVGVGLVVYDYRETVLSR